MNPFRTVYRVEIIIDASAEQVWDVLVDLDRYSEWNPFTPEVRSSLEVGSPVDMQVRLKGRLRPQRETVRRITPNAQICWGMTMLGGIVVRGERCQWLEQLGPQKTRYISEDIISGAAAPLVSLMFGRSLRLGFDALAEALKRRVEREVEDLVRGVTGRSVP